MERETVAAAGVNADPDVEVVWVCADTSAAVAKKRMTRDSFFTMFLDLGEKEIANHLYGAG